MGRRDFDQTEIRLFGRDFQASSLIAAGLWWIGGLIALAVGLSVWRGGLAVAAILALVGLMVAAAG